MEAIIRPSSDLRNHYSEISKECHENRQPVIITVNGRGDIALNYLDKSRNIKDSEEKIYLLAEIYTKKCKINDAIEIYSDLLKNNPNNIEYAIALINIHVMNRNYLSARKVLKMFLKNNPNEKNNPRFNSYGILNLGL